MPLDLERKDAEEFSLSDAQVLLSDFGEAFAPAQEVRRGEDSHKPLYMRPPESRFEPQAPLSFSADIWSMAITIWEIIGMKPIFTNEVVTADGIIRDHVDVLGPMPSDWWKRWEERSRFFYKDGRPKKDRDRWPALDTAFEDNVQKFRRKNGWEFCPEESATILDLMRRMLIFRPEERPTVDEVVKLEWMVKWALPDFNCTDQVDRPDKRVYCDVSPLMWVKPGYVYDDL